MQSLSIFMVESYRLLLFNIKLYLRFVREQSFLHVEETCKRSHTILSRDLFLFKVLVFQCG